MDTAHPAIAARSFALRLIAWSLALFGVLRLASVETQILLPMTRLQAAAGSALIGPSTLPIEATLACSGADALALCLAAVVAYPARWRMRVAGAAGGAAVLLILNVVRIGTLGRAAAFPRWFDLLHLYVWPAVLTLAIAGFVFTWMRLADRRVPGVPGVPGAPGLRFFLLAAAGLLVFTLAAPLYLESAWLLMLATLVARAAAALLRGAGVDATAAGGFLATPRGAFQVTQECIATPLIPIYFAAVLVYGRSWQARALGFAAALPAFIALGIARLLVVAVPGLGVSPAFFVHTFSQLLVGAGLVAGLAMWRHGLGTATFARTAIALTLAFVWGRWAGEPYAQAIGGFGTAGHRVADPQGALMFLPAFQSGLFIAFWLAAWAPARTIRFLCGALLLAAIQVSVVAAVRAVGVPPVLAIRAWALVCPVLVFALVVHGFRRADERPARVQYRRFWHEVGAHFPDLGGAASTKFYFDNETRLVGAHLGTLAGKRVLKTDLWDEARNTRILQWIRRQGAHVVGVDISMPVVHMAGPGLAGVNADVRALPFGAGSFDAVYSMGTIEHFAETDDAVREIFRVTKPGGRAVIGVPNRRDPFLRPLLVAILYRMGLYGYGFEKSYSRQTLRRMLENAGFVVTGDDGILFMPGWLRMLDLLCHTRYPAAARATAAGVRLFRWIDAHIPAVRRHGYLIVAVGDRPW